LAFFGYRSFLNEGIVSQSRGVLSANSYDAPIGDPTGPTPIPTLRDSTAHARSFDVPNFTLRVHFIVYDRTGGCDIVTPLPQSSPRVAYAREGPARSRVQGTRIRTLPSRASRARAFARREHSPRAKSVRERRDVFRL
jgi:hypothetical protein